MSRIKEAVVAFHRSEEGDIVQTGIVLGILAVIALGAMMFLQEPIRNLFTRASDEIQSGADFDNPFD